MANGDDRRARGGVRRWASVAVPMACTFLMCLMALPARAAFNNTTPRGTFAGTHNYAITGKTLRTDDNDGDSCAVRPSNYTSSATLSGVRASTAGHPTTIMKAYLYWAGSGSSPDMNVTFNGHAVTGEAATDNFVTDLNNHHYDLEYFSGVADVTDYVTGDGTYTFSGLTVADDDDPPEYYCEPSAVIAGWALVVVYKNDLEPYRYTRVYDGMRYFRGSSVTTTQSGFRVPDLQNGKVSIITWEGDPDVGENASSHPLDGYTESLSFDGHPLLNSGCDGTDNLYNSTISDGSGSSTFCDDESWGLDIDTYDVTDYLYEGQTGATLEYSSGNDLVFLSTQVISTTNTPVADLAITKTHEGDHFTVGQEGKYDIEVHNLGPEIATGTASVIDTLPTGLTYVSGSGTGWSCSAVGQVVTCNNSQTTIDPCIPPAVPDSSCALPTLVLTVAVGIDAAASIDNTAAVSHPMFDGTGGNQESTDTVEVHASDLSSSTKSVVDANGGEVEPGDTLHYTLTLENDNDWGIDATGVNVVDDLAANVGNLLMVSIPAGAVDNSVGSGGANGTGQVNVSGITVPAGETREVKFDVVVSAEAGPGDTVDNSATITSASGPGANPSAPTLTIPDTSTPSSGNKLLYLLMSAPDTQDPPPVGHDLTRARPTTSNTMTWSRNDYARYQYFYLPPLVKPLELNDNTVTVTLQGRRSGGDDDYRARGQFFLNGVDGSDSISGNTASMDFNVTNYTSRSANVDLDQTSFDVGDQLILRVENRDRNNDIQLIERNGTNYSAVTLNAATVINVDSVKFYDAQYPATTTKTMWEPGDHVFIRADISDPFGGFDVSATNSTLTLADADGGPLILDAATMSPKTNPTEGDGVANRILEYDYTIPPGASLGTWTATVKGSEGSENTVSHTRANTFTVVPKALDVVKSHDGDFTAGANNVYTLEVKNNGTTTVAGTTTVTDTLATGLTFVSADGGAAWDCTATGQVVSCESSDSVAAGDSMPLITLTVFVAGNMGSSVANQAKVSNSTVPGAPKPGNTDTAVIRHPDLSTSTKSVVDTNFGDANPGDTLRYSITVIESAGYPANNVTVTDVLPFGLDAPTGLNAGLTTCNGTATIAGGTLTVTGLTLAGGASCDIVFEPQISASAGTGLVIDNEATIANPSGPGATPDASITVAQSQVLNPGSKVLYVYANNSMTRVAQTANGNNTINENTYQDFTLGAVQGALTIAPGSTIDVYAWLRRTGSTTTQDRTIYAKLLKNGSTQIGSVSVSVTFNSTNAARQHFTITAPSFGTSGNLVPGDTLTLRLFNDSGTGGNNRSVRFDQRVTGGSTADDLSIVTISTPTVVHVDSVAVYSAAYPATTQAAAYGAGNTVYIRATTSDPFGYADISGGSVTIKDSTGATVETAVLVNGTHTVSTSGSTRIYEYPYTLAGTPATGAWTVGVTANEGSEVDGSGNPTISHTGNGGFSVGGTVTLRKEWGSGATAGNAVTLKILGGTNAVDGSSTAPSTLTAATSNAATGATITLQEAFTIGVAGDYTITLTCEKDADHTTINPSGTGLSRTIVMPAASVTCTWHNTKSIPLTVVKLASVVSDPVNGTTNPKAIPGATVKYTIIVTNPGAAVDAGTLLLTDPTPANVALLVSDIAGSGSGPVTFQAGSSGLTYTFSGLTSDSDNLVFSNSHQADWGYHPTAGADGTDPTVTDLQVKPQGVFVNSGQFTVEFLVKIQ